MVRLIPCPVLIKLTHFTPKRKQEYQERYSSLKIDTFIVIKSTDDTNIITDQFNHTL